MTEKDKNSEKIVGSSALEQADYWWFQVRSKLLAATFTPFIERESRILDVGSSNSPSVQWLKDLGSYTPMDVDPRGLPPEGIVGSILDIPFNENELDVVGAFDVIEHIADDQKAVQEIYRVLKPGGKLILSVPAYEWAWSGNDVHNAHFRRYTRRRMNRLLKREGFTVRRSTYAFHHTFPLFAVNTVLTKIKERRIPPEPLPDGEVHALPPTGKIAEKILYKLSDRDEKRILSGHNLPFGSSLFVCAEKPVL